MSTKLKPDELKQIQVERCIESMFSDNECREAVLNSCRYLERNGCLAESSLDNIIPIALAVSIELPPPTATKTSAPNSLQIFSPFNTFVTVGFGFTSE